jgi:hypothetical protein
MLSRHFLILWLLPAASTAAFAFEPCGTGSYPFPYTDVAGVGDPFCPRKAEGLTGEGSQAASNASVPSLHLVLPRSQGG